VRRVGVQRKAVTGAVGVGALGVATEGGTDMIGVAAAEVAAPRGQAADRVLVEGDSP
jgi:hypothetical protein